MALTVPNPIDRDGFQFDSLLTQLFNFLFIAAGALAVLMIIVSGLMFIVSFGDQERRGRAASTFLHAILGLVIIFVAYILVNFVLEALGASPAYRPSAG